MAEYLSYMRPETSSCHIPQEDLRNIACVRGVQYAPESCSLRAELNVGDAAAKLGSMVTVGKLGLGTVESEQFMTTRSRVGIITIKGSGARMVARGI